MKTFFACVGERIKEERSRLNYGETGVADACRVSRRALSDWENGRTTPNSEALALMSVMGFDVLYIVTGTRSTGTESTLAPDEHNLLEVWRHTDDKGRALLSAAAELLKPE